MTAIFISHRSTDAEAAASIKGWLAAQGHKRFFLDVDPEDGIAGGAAWEKAIYDALRQCQALLVVRTPDWDASRWCFAELALARARGKAIFVVRARPCAGGPLLPELQEVDLTTDREGGLIRLARGLKEKGLDPEDSFDRDPSRPIYPGLNPFDEADAAIFFGREEESWEGVAALEELRRGGQEAPRLLLVTGASGSGKSSLMRAGILPRLRRDPTHWLGVRPFRPGDDPSPARALALALVEQGGETAADAATTAVESAPALLARVRRLKATAGRPQATVLLAIDQAEELLQDAEGGQLLALIAMALAEARGELLAVATLRSDRLGAWQEHAAVQGQGGGPRLKVQSLVLGPVPLERVAELVRGPARHLDLEVEDALVDAIREDVETPGALPLLAYMLQQLHARAGQQRRLTLAGYEALGRLEGVIGKAADRAIAAAQPSPADLEALRSALIPGLVRVGESGLLRLRAGRERVPARAEPLIQKLIEARLLTTDRVEGRETIEIAHEALLRGWPLAARWLSEDAAKLRLLEDLRRAAADWQAGDRSADLLVHRGKRLRELRAVLRQSRFADGLSEEERHYVEACRRRRRRASIARVAAGVVASALAVGLFLLSGVPSQKEAALIWAGLELASDQSLLPDEVDQLWRLTEAGATVRQAFLEQLEADPLLVAKLARHPEPVARAFGLTPSPPSVETTVAAMLERPDLGGAPERLASLARLLERLPVPLSDAQAAAALAALLSQARPGATLTQLATVAGGLQALALRLTAEQAAAASAPILRALAASEDRPRSLALGQALPTLVGRLAPDGARAVRGPLLATFHASLQDLARLQVLARALGALPGTMALAPAQLDPALGAVLDGLRGAPDAPMGFQPARTLEALAPALDPEQAGLAFGPLIDRLATSATPRVLQAAAGAGRALAGRLDAQEAQRRFDELLALGTAQAPAHPASRDAQGAVLEALAQRLSPAEAAARAGPILAGLEASLGEPARLRLLARALTALPVTLDGEAADGMLALGLERLRGSPEDTELAAVRTALEAVARRLAPAPAAAAQATLLRTLTDLRRAGRQDRLWVLVPALGALGPALTPEQAAPAADLLLDAMLSHGDPVQLDERAAALESLAHGLAAARARAGLEILLGGLEPGAGPLRLGAQARALRVLVARVQPGPVAGSGTALDLACRGLAEAGTVEEATGWAGVAEAVLRVEAGSPAAYLARLIEMLKYPTAAGEVTDDLLQRLQERFPEAPGGTAGLAPNLAWIGRQVPEVDLAGGPVRPR